MGKDTPLHQTKTGVAVGSAVAAGNLNAARTEFWNWWIANDLDGVCMRFTPRWVRKIANEDVTRDILSFVMDKALRYVEDKGHVPSFGELKQMVNWEAPDVAKAHVRHDPAAVLDRIERPGESPEEQEARESRISDPLGSPAPRLEGDHVAGGSFTAPEAAVDQTAYWELVRELPGDSRADYRRAGRLLAWLLMDPTIKRTKVDKAEGWSEQQGKNAMAALKKVFRERFGE